MSSPPADSSSAPAAVPSARRSSATAPSPRTSITSPADPSAPHPQTGTIRSAGSDGKPIATTLDDIKDVIEHHNRIVAARSIGEEPAASDQEHEIVPMPVHRASVESMDDHNAKSLKQKTGDIMTKLTDIYDAPESSAPLQAKIRDQLMSENNPNNNNTAKFQSVPLFTEEALNFPTRDWIYSMRFPNAALEHHFNACYYSKAVLMVRLTVFFIFLINCFAGVTDLAVYTASQRENIWIIRYSAITPACLIYLALTRHSIFFSYRQLATAVFCVFVATMLMWISALGAQPNHGIYMIILNVYSLFLGFHYIVSTIVNFVVFLIFIGWNYNVTVVQGASDGSVESETAYSNSHQWLLSFAYILLTALMLIVVGYFIESSFRGAFLQMQRLRCEQHKTNIVLYNILPKNIAMNLVRGIRSADYYSSASVLFCDIYDFKHLTTSLSSTELVAMLNDIFSTMDRITDQHDVLKIETIGEVYMVASGLPEESDTHAESIAYFALDIQLIADNFYCLYNTQTKKYNYRSKRIQREQITGRRLKIEKANVEKKPIQFRIGINSGDVIAGVIGVKLPRYRLFGDAVNTASRMESTCPPSKIQLSASTFQLVKETFLFEDRGEIPVKGKGMMHTYFLTGRNNAYEHRMSSLQSIDGFTILRDPNASKTAKTGTDGSSAQGSFLTQMLVKKSMSKAKRDGQASAVAVPNMRPIAELEDSDDDEDEGEEERERNAIRRSESPTPPETKPGDIEMQQMDGEGDRGRTNSMASATSAEEEKKAESPKLGSSEPAKARTNAHQRTRTAADLVSIAIGAFKSGMKEKPDAAPVSQSTSAAAAAPADLPPELQPGSSKTLKKAALSVMRQRAATTAMVSNSRPVATVDSQPLNVVVDQEWEAHNASIMMRTLRRKGSMKRLTVGSAAEPDRPSKMSIVEQPNLYLTTASLNRSGSLRTLSVTSGQ